MRNVANLETHSAIGGQILGTEESLKAVTRVGLNKYVLPNVLETDIGTPVKIHSQRTPSRVNDLLIPAHLRPFNRSHTPIEAAIEEFLLESAIPHKRPVRNRSRLNPLRQQGLWPHTSRIVRMVCLGDHVQPPT